MTVVTSGRLPSQAATAAVFEQWRSIRSGSVSIPCRVRNALNGDIAEPRSRSRVVRALMI